MQVAEAQARLEHNKRYVAFLQHQIDIKEARAARQKAQEDEVSSSHRATMCNQLCNIMALYILEFLLQIRL